MRLFHIEQSLDYSQYCFGYRPMLELEPGDDLAEVYARGFLPYSAQPSDGRDLFYLARSIRWPLDRLTVDKKRRYDFRRFDLLEPVFTVRPKSDALSATAHWQAAAFGWMRERFGDAYLSEERFVYIVSKDFCSHVAEVSVAGQPFARVLLVVDKGCVHYWYAFFDTLRFPGHSPGKWLMLRTALWARQEGIPWLYVGTGYTDSAAYKTQGIAGAEFYDGTAWSNDLSELRRRQAADSTT